jgi:ATP adenylyltransferase
MTYKDLENFLTTRMRMSHIYQPVMIKCLLEHDGVATDTVIAKELLQYDPSQLEYYQVITNRMVGKVLRSHRVVEKEKNLYSLTAYQNLTHEQKEELISICEQKLDEYVKKRGDAIWEHRKKNRRYISGSIRYEVLKRAKGRCELCGVPHTERALEVDHIVPVNLGGSDSINNYQALCYICNSMKADRDSTDFRGMNQVYNQRERGCLFCEMNDTKIISENNLAYVIYDQYAVTELHCLIIPKRHTENYFEISQAEVNAVNQLLLQSKNLISKTDKTVSGFNIGINCGATSGQTVMHTHLHLIPRRKGDLENPKGGIRNIISGNGDYLKTQ